MCGALGAGTPAPCRSALLLGLKELDLKMHWLQSSGLQLGQAKGAREAAGPTGLVVVLGQHKPGNPRSVVHPTIIAAEAIL